MMKLMIELLMLLRQLMFKMFSVLFEKVRDQKTGKLTFISPNQIRTTFMWLSFLVFIGLIVYKMHLTNQN